ncbi:MAG: hypothetical protein RLZZ429_7 [Bacteroidota bacterium]
MIPLLQNSVGRRGFEPLKSKDSGFTVRPIWPLWNLPISFTLIKIISKMKMSRRWDSNPRPADYKSAALPAELLRLVILKAVILSGKKSNSLTCFLV